MIVYHNLTSVNQDDDDLSVALRQLESLLHTLSTGWLQSDEIRQRQQDLVVSILDL